MVFKVISVKGKDYNLDQMFQGAQKSVVGRWKTPVYHVEINDIDELLKLTELVDNGIIIEKLTDEYEIAIYDDYVE